MQNIGCALENDGRHMPQWHGASGKEDKSQLQHWNYDISVQCLVSFKGSGQLLTADATFRLLFRWFGWYICKALHDLRTKRWCWIAQTFQLQPSPTNRLINWSELRYSGGHTSVLTYPHSLGPASAKGLQLHICTAVPGRLRLDHPSNACPIFN